MFWLSVAHHSTLFKSFFYVSIPFILLHSLSCLDSPQSTHNFSTGADLHVRQFPLDTLSLSVVYDANLPALLASILHSPEPSSSDPTASLDHTPPKSSSSPYPSQKLQLRMTQFSNDKSLSKHLPSRSRFFHAMTHASKDDSMDDDDVVLQTQDDIVESPSLCISRSFGSLVRPIPIPNTLSSAANASSSSSKHTSSPHPTTETTTPDDLSTNTPFYSELFGSFVGSYEVFLIFNL